jgi:hypothetical protein
VPTTASPTATSTTAVLARVRSHLGGPQILLGVVAPFVVYQVATGLGASDLAALAWGAAFRSPGSHWNSHGAAAST